jgi:hypothetical protein
MVGVPCGPHAVIIVVSISKTGKNLLIIFFSMVPLISTLIDSLGIFFE